MKAVSFIVVAALGVVSTCHLFFRGKRRIASPLGGVEVSRKADARPRTTKTHKGAIPAEHRGKLKLFILAGQSNMSGRGDVPRWHVDPDPRIYVFGNDYIWRPAAEPIDDPRNQVDRISEDRIAGFSPALAFAKAVLEHHPDLSIGLIPCAKGGSSIYEWRRNQSDNTLYGSCLKRAHAASRMGRVAGLLFFQGESDALDPMRHPQMTLLPGKWEENFTVIVSHWRSDLKSPELPVVFAQIGTNRTPGQFPNWKIVQEQQQRVRLPFVAMITTDDLTLKDTVHFTTEGYVTIGRRFAGAYLGIQRDTKR